MAKRTNTDRTYLNLVYFDWDKFMKAVERVAKKIGIVATMRGNSGSQRKDEYWALPANYNRRLA